MGQTELRITQILGSCARRCGLSYLTPSANLGGESRNEEKGGHAGDFYTLEETHVIDVALSRLQASENPANRTQPRGRRLRRWQTTPPSSLVGITSQTLVLRRSSAAPIPASAPTPYSPSELRLEATASTARPAATAPACTASARRAPACLAKATAAPAWLAPAPPVACRALAIAASASTASPAKTA